MKGAFSCLGIQGYLCVVCVCVVVCVRVRTRVPVRVCVCVSLRVPFASPPFTRSHTFLILNQEMCCRL